MNYPYKAEPVQTVGSDLNVSVVCDEECAENAQLIITDELTDGWIAATENATCPGCGRLLILAGKLTYAHYEKETPNDR